MHGVPRAALTCVRPLQAILGHPLALVKLGMFLRDVSELRQQHRPNHEVKPTIIIGPADAYNECLIVAVTKESFGNSSQQTQVLKCLAPTA